jgi:pilus assembly protein CpaE
VWLDIIPDYTIQDVAENITRLDYALLKRSLTKHECGAFLLPRPIHMEEATPINPEELRRVITLLKATFTHLIVDISKNFGPLELAAMRLSDTILLMGQLDLPCLRNVVRLLQFFDRQEGIPEKIKVVINRLGLEETQISLTKAVETIGREIFWQLPNDYATMVESRNNGVPLITQAPKSKLTRSIQQLAQAIDKGSTTVVPEEVKKGKSLFRFLSSGSSK